MFERFTNSARAVLVEAQDEAAGLGHNFIGTEHVMLGVVRSGDPVVAQILKGYDFTLEDLRQKVTDMIGSGPDPTGSSGGPVPFTPRAKKVLELSLREALSLGHNHIAPPHLLLGILREGEGVGAQILAAEGVDYDRARVWVGETIESQEIRGRRGRGRLRRRDFLGEVESMLGTPPTRRLPRLAKDAAGADIPGTHHYLLALFDDDTSLAAKVLDAVGVTKEQVEAKIADLGVAGTSDAPPAPPPRPTTVTLAEGVDVRITDPDLAKLVESGQLEDLLAEIIRRAKPA
jgi:ATP-dependent Clp protease ATP-binding subunit ClpA